MKVGFIGLGGIGKPMAISIARAGFELTVNDLREQPQKDLEQHGARVARTAREVASVSDIVLASLPSNEASVEVALGADGVLAGASDGDIYVELSTISPQVVHRISREAAEIGVEVLDAPVSGGMAQRREGRLSVMVGGDAAVFDRAKGVIDSYAKIVKLMGDVGSGQLTKMVNQVCIAGIVQGLSEGLHFAEKVGLDLDAVVDVISQGAAQSWQMDNRAATMARREFEFGFAVNWMRKDLDMTLAAAREVDARMPLAALVDQFYADVQAFGGGRWDTSSLIERLRRVDAS